MRAKTRLRLLVLLVLAASLSLAGCAGDASGDSTTSSIQGGDEETTTTESAEPASTTTVAPEQVDGDLVLGVSTLLEVFDPAAAQPVAKQHLVLMYDHLVGVNEDATDVSRDTGIFSDWQTDDSQTWTFTIRDGYTFHNGEPLTAEDIKFSLDRLQDEATATAAYTLWFRGNVASTEVVDDSTIAITLNAPSFQLPLYLSPLFGNEGSVIPQAYYEEVGAEGFQAAPIGTGPYRLASHEPGVSITYEKVENHPVDADAAYQTVEYRVIAETGTRLSLFETGELDVIDVGTAEAASLADSDGVVIVEKPAGNQVGITLHEQWIEGSPLGNEMIRQALAVSVDAVAINDALFGGLGHVTGNYPAGPLSIGFEELEPYPFDPDTAAGLLTEAGYDGTTIELYGYPLPGLPELPDVAEAVQGYWSAIGVNVELIPTEFSTFVQDWTGYTLGVAASPVGFAHRPLGMAYYDNGFWSEGGSTVTHDDQIDALVEQGRAAAADESAYAATTAEANQYVYDHYLSIPIVTLNSFYATRTGMEWDAGQGQYDLNARELVSP